MFISTSQRFRASSAKSGRRQQSIRELSGDNPGETTDAFASEPRLGFTGAGPLAGTSDLEFTLFAF